MITIDLSVAIKQEYDVVDGAYCFECFSSPSGRYLSFFNGHGPFCNKKCFAKYLGIEYRLLPIVDRIGKVK
jgi:hypothetical protein